MEKKRPGPRYSPVLPVLALAVILAGLFAMSGVFTGSQRQLLDGQDGQLTKTAQSVDNNILGHFVWYCSDLEYITARTGFLRAEADYLAGGGAEELLCYLRESPLPKTVMVELMLVLREGAVVLSTGDSADYVFLSAIGQIGQVGVSLWADGAGRPYVALLLEKEELSYAALIDGEVFFAIAERQTAADSADRILVLDAAERFFFHRTQQGIRVDPVNQLDPAVHSSLGVMLEVQPRQGSSRPGGSRRGEATRRVCPSSPPPAMRTAALPWGWPGTTSWCPGPSGRRRFRWPCAGCW